jgi:hypothetical protein
LPIVDKAFIFYNSEGKHEILAQKQIKKSEYNKFRKVKQRKKIYYDLLRKA